MKETAGVDGCLASRQREGAAVAGARAAATPPAADVLASRLLRYEAGGQQGAERLAAATERVFARLRRRLVVVVGTAGYAALAERSLQLAQERVPALGDAALTVGADGTLTGAREFAMAVDAPAATDGLTAVVAALIGLLVAFIGEDLTDGLVQQAWPEFAPGTDRTEEDD
jgi:hypothetical protein